MKTIKRTVAALLAALVLSTSVNVLAAETYTAKEEVVVAKVNAAGIMTGTDKGFEPSKSLTRAEAAAIIVRMKGINESAVKATAGTTLFADVAASHWASGYVNQASNLGIVKGVSATEFAPDREVTVAEFTTMAVRALGAGQLVDSEGTWPTNYVNFANENGILDDVNAIYTATATRMNAATIVVNTLTTKMWEKTGVKSNGEIEWSNLSGKTILTNVLDITAYDKKSGSFAAEACDGTKLSNKNHSFNDHKVVETLDLSNVKAGLTYDFWMNEDGEICGLWETENKDLTKVDFTEIKKVERNSTTPDVIEKITLVVDGSEKEYKVTNSLTLSINETTYDADDKISSNYVIAKNELLSGVAYLDGTKLAAMYGEQYATYAIVDEVKTKSITFKSVEAVASTDSDIKLDEDKYDYFFTKDGKKVDVTDLEEDDAIAFYSTSEKYVGIVLTDSIEGKVSSKSSSKETVKIDGKSYKAASTALFNALKNDQEIIAYTNAAGNIAMFKVVENAAGSVAIVKSSRVIEDQYKSDNYEVVLFYTDGTESDKLTVDFEETYENFADAYEKATATEKANMLAVLPTASSDPQTYTVKTTTTYASKKAAGKAIFEEILGAANAQEGKPAIYEVSGTKVSLVPADVKEPEYVSATGKLTFKKNSAFVGTVEVDENTKFFKLKSDKDYSVKVEEISYDSLDDTDFNSGSFMTDLTYKDGSVDYAGVVVFADGSNKVQRTADFNLVFVEDYQQGKKSRTIDVIKLDGSRESYTVDDSADVYKKLDGVLNTLIDAKVVDGQLVDVDAVAEKTAGTPEDDTIKAYNNLTNYVAKYNSNKTVITLANDLTLATSDTTKTLVVADDLLVLELTEDGEYEVRSLSDINAYKNAPEANTDYEKIIGVVNYVVDAESTYSTSELEAKVIIYQIAKATN